MNRKPRPESPIETGTVAALTHDGEGVVRGEGKTAFVCGALPGEVVRFQRKKRHRQYDEAVLVEVMTAAADRVPPPCAHFGMCGGCSLQHLSPDKQIEAKHAELRETLERVGKVSPDEWLEPLRGPDLAYRRRARLGARFVIKKGRVVVGFRERLSHFVAALERCRVLAAPLGELIEPLGVLLSSLTIREHIPQIEVAAADNATALVLRVMQPPSASDLEQLADFERAHGVRFYLQTGGLDTVARMPGAPTESPLNYRLPDFDVELEFTPTDFVQINGPMNRLLVSRAVELMQLTPESRVLDLYCGLGNFTLALARKAGHVVGVEGEAALIERARHNARRNGITHAEFHTANLAEPPPSDAIWRQSGFTHVLLDPPRVGAREVLSTVAQFEPQRVLYISCHPGSLARDVGILVHDHGFTLRAAGVLDMFPHTNHVESLAVLEPSGRYKKRDA